MKVVIGVGVLKCGLRFPDCGHVDGYRLGWVHRLLLDPVKTFLSEAADCLITARSDLGAPEVEVASSREQAAGSQAAAAVVQQILPPGPLLLGSQQGGGVRRRAGGI